MEKIMENVNLDEISILKNNSVIFTFINCYNGAFYKKIKCEKILKYCVESEVDEQSEFAYFVGDVFLKELNTDELKSAINYYKYGFNVNISVLGKQYLLVIIGSDICIEVLGGKMEVTS